MTDKEKDSETTEIPTDTSETSCGNTDKRQIVGQQLEQKFEEQLKANNDSVYTDKIFGVENLPEKKQAQKNIEQYKAEALKKDLDSKLKYRKPVINWLLPLLAIQIIFMNVIVAFVFFSQMVLTDWTVRLDISLLANLTDLAKWYTTAVLTELIAVFCYVVKAVFAKPST